MIRIRRINTPRVGRAIGCIVFFLPTGIALAYEYKTVEPLAIESMYDEVSAEPDARIREESDLWRISMQTDIGYVTYFFTREGHPAHPAVVIRSVFRDQTGVDIEDRGLTAGDTEIFEGWMRLFEEQHNTIRERLSQANKSDSSESEQPEAANDEPEAANDEPEAADDVAAAADAKTGG